MTNSSAKRLAAPLAWRAVGRGVTLRSATSRLGLAALASARLALARLVARLRRSHLGQRLALEQVGQVLGGVDRERDATLEELGQGWPLS